MNPTTESPVKGLGVTKMRRIVRVIMAIVANGILGAIYGSIAGSLYGFLFMLISGSGDSPYAHAGAIVGAIYGVGSGFVAGAIGGSIGGPSGWGIGGFVGGFGIAICCWSMFRSIVLIVLPGFIGGSIGIMVGWAMKRGIGHLLPLLMPVEWLIVIMTKLEFPLEELPLWQRSAAGLTVAVIFSGTIFYCI
jgi:hypothetical protein